MKLCIADPPYLGVADLWYGDSGSDRVASLGKSGLKGASAGATAKADRHPDAHLWDNPATHEALVLRLCAEYDGWAIAMKEPSLPAYLSWTPPPFRVAAWIRPTYMPTGSRPVRSWEPVLLRIPDGRRNAKGNRMPVRDVLTGPNHGRLSRNDVSLSLANAKSPGFAGAKPPAWTRWVLDMLGYDPETDTVDDLFHGSGAVSAEVAQGVMVFDGDGAA